MLRSYHSASVPSMKLNAPHLFSFLRMDTIRSIPSDPRTKRRAWPPSLICLAYLGNAYHAMFLLGRGIYIVQRCCLADFAASHLACLPLQLLVVSRMSLPVLPKTQTPSAVGSTGDAETKSITQEQGDAYSEKEVASTVEIDPAVERSALWKVDMVVVPIVGMYCTCCHTPFRCIRSTNIAVLRFAVIHRK